jgi:hypothetical protein
MVVGCILEHDYTFALFKPLEVEKPNRGPFNSLRPSSRGCTTTPYIHVYFLVGIVSDSVVLLAKPRDKGCLRLKGIQPYRYASSISKLSKKSYLYRISIVSQESKDFHVRQWGYF